MDIFVANLPRKTSVLELRKLVGQKGNAHYRIFNRKKPNGRSCCLGKAVVSCSNTATDIISRLNGLVFNGCQLSVRAMHYRSEMNERRKRIVYCLTWNGVNRRRSERRLIGL